MPSKVRGPAFPLAVHRRGVAGADVGRVADPPRWSRCPTHSTPTTWVVLRRTTHRSCAANDAGCDHDLALAQPGDAPAPGGSRFGRSSVDDLLGHLARGTRRIAERTQLHDASPHAGIAEIVCAACFGRQQPRFRGRRSRGVHSGHYSGHRSRAASDRRGMRRGDGAECCRGHGRLSAAFGARHRAVAISQTPASQRGGRASSPGSHLCGSRA